MLNRLRLYMLNNMGLGHQVERIVMLLLMALFEIPGVKSMMGRITRPAVL
jgi:hypothetical protein